MTTDITIRWADNLRCRIESDAGISYEIFEEFSFFVNGYKFMPLFKAGRWDGKIKMYDIKKRLFYIGLLPRLIEWADANGYSISFEDKSKFKESDIYDTAQVEDIFKTAIYQPKWYQRKAVEYALKHGKVLTLSPTASGKSLMIYYLIRYVLEHTEDRILISVPSKSLVEQLYSDFEKYSADGWQASDHVNRLHGERKDKNPHARVLLTTWQSVYKREAEFFENFDTYICDEAHSADGKSISGIVEKLKHAPRRYGFTGTLDGSMMHELEMLARFGTLHRVVTTKELMDDGDVSNLLIDAYILKYSEEECKLLKSADYQQEINFLVGHKERNKILASLALAAEGNTIMLFNFIEKHGELLYNILKPACEKIGKKLYYIHGATDVDDRETIRQLLEKNDNCILLASFGTFSVGVSVNNLHNAIFCHPYKATIRTLQSIGRILRLAAGKHNAKLIDIGDQLTYTSKSGKTKANTVFKHFISRLEIYQKEKFKYRIIEKTV